MIFYFAQIITRCIEHWTC